LLWAVYEGVKESKADAEKPSERAARPPESGGRVARSDGISASPRRAFHSFYDRAYSWTCIYVVVPISKVLLGRES
jgi:hypothetical protein